jgi:hypothetical protein
MKNLLKLFGLSIILSISGLNAWEKTYVDSEDITFEDGTIYLHLKNGDLQPITAIYSDEKGIYAYVLNQDDELDQPTEQEIFYTQDNQDALDQTIKEETLYTQNAYRELMAGYECPNCTRINPRHRKTCKDCGATIIH